MSRGKKAGTPPGDDRRTRRAAEAEPSPLLAEWERTLRRWAERRAVFEAATGKMCTFRELDARARAWAASHLPPEEVVEGRAVVFALANGIGWLEAFLGLLRAGAVVVPLDGAEPPAAQRAMAAALRAAYWWNGDRLEALPEPRRFRDPSICLVKLTSGTTGKPRPLAFTAAQLLADAEHVTSTMRIRPSDLNYALIPFGHSYGLGNVTLPLIAHGVPVVCGGTPLPHAIAEEFAQWKPTVFPTVPAMVRALAAADVAPGSFASLRLTISAGAPLPRDVAQAFAARFGQRVHNFYGSSETGGIAFDRAGRATLEGGVGTAMRGVTIRRLRGQRIQVSSAAVFTLQNRRRHGRDGAWIPADRATIDRAGEITLLGRRGATVKIGGRRVNLAEVAARLRRTDGVRDVWVGVNGGAEPVIGAVLVGTRTAAEIRAALLSDTAPWKVPKKWAVLDEFPLNARGKVDTRALHAAVFK